MYNKGNNIESGHTTIGIVFTNVSEVSGHESGHVFPDNADIGHYKGHFVLYSTKDTVGNADKGQYK